MQAEHGANEYSGMSENELRRIARERGLSADDALDRDGLLGLLEARDQYDAAQRAQTDAYGGKGDQSADEAALVGSTDESPGGIRRDSEPAPVDSSEDDPTSEHSQQ